jgi:hypothetical protein
MIVTSSMSVEYARKMTEISAFWSLVLACWYECLIVFHFTNNKNIKTTLFLCIHIYIKSAWYKPILTWNKNMNIHTKVPAMTLSFSIHTYENNKVPKLQEI